MRFRRRQLRLGALVVGVALGWLAPAPADPLADCAARLERTLAAMRARPLLKEELATGLMWKRLDAAAALESGDARGCLAQVREVETLLGLLDPATEPAE